METLILNRIQEKLRNDFPDEWIQNSEIRYKEYRDGKYVWISERIVYKYLEDSDYYSLDEQDEEGLPDELKALFLGASSIYPKEEFDPLSKPMRNRVFSSDNGHGLMKEEQLRRLKK